MQDDYLWDGSGEPDPEIRQLEAMLSKFRHCRPAANFAEGAPTTRQRAWPRILRVQLAPALAVAAAGLMVGAVWLAMRRAKSQLQSGWNVTCVVGSPRLGSEALRRGDKAGKLAVGQILETDNRSKATIAVGQLGEVEVDPDTRVRLIKAISGEKRLALDRGTIRAAIWAPPGEFVVDTPSAVAVDLGCAYTLHVDDSGAGLLRTTLGWVGFKLGNRESFIPAGAVCATRPQIGPGTPYFEDASESFRAAISKLDFGSLSPKQRSTELGIVLAHARRRDALTLWHLLARTDGPERQHVYARLAELAPPPAGVTREGILLLDPKMLDLWWNALGYGNVALWRTFEGSWPRSASGANPRP
ncbi:MAG: FecR domain-containing protein [Acidobacteriota bacterium]|nr:FecR domain-containing protein [Acidobacteriota bacterium]